MKPQICICCGEPIARRGHALSRNPNVCASCSSMADGMTEMTEDHRIQKSGAAGNHPRTEANASEPAPSLVSPAENEIVLDWSAGQVLKRTSSTAPK